MRERGREESFTNADIKIQKHSKLTQSTVYRVFMSSSSGAREER